MIVGYLILTKKANRGIIDNNNKIVKIIAKDIKEIGLVEFFFDYIGKMQTKSFFILVINKI